MKAYIGGCTPSNVQKRSGISGKYSNLSSMRSGKYSNLSTKSGSMTSRPDEFECREIVAFGSLVLDQPLQHNFYTYTTVTIYPKDEGPPISHKNPDIINEEMIPTIGNDVIFSLSEYSERDNYEKKGVEVITSVDTNDFAVKDGGEDDDDADDDNQPRKSRIFASKRYNSFDNNDFEEESRKFDWDVSHRELDDYESQKRSKFYEWIITIIFFCLLCFRISAVDAHYHPYIHHCLPFTISAH